MLSVLGELIVSRYVHSRINNNWCRTYRPHRPLSTAYITVKLYKTVLFCTQSIKAYAAETSCISCYWFCYISAHDQFAWYNYLDTCASVNMAISVVHTGYGPPYCIMYVIMPHIIYLLWGPCVHCKSESRALNVLSVQWVTTELLRYQSSQQQDNLCIKCMNSG